MEPAAPKRYEANENTEAQIKEIAICPESHCGRAHIFKFS